MIKVGYYYQNKRELFTIRIESIDGDSVSVCSVSDVGCPICILPAYAIIRDYVEYNP